MGKKVLRSVYLESEQMERLKRLSATTRVPQAVYIREGLDLVMKKYEKRIQAEKPGRRSRRGRSGTLTVLK